MPPYGTYQHKHRSKREIVPKNGRHIVAVLAGGIAKDFPAIRDKLASKGVELIDHRDIDKPKEFSRPIPHRADVVIVLTDAIAHDELIAITAEIGCSAVECVHTSRKASRLIDALAWRGLLRPFAVFEPKQPQPGGDMVPLPLDRGMPKPAPASEPPAQVRLTVVDNKATTYDPATTKRLRGFAADAPGFTDYVSDEWTDFNRRFIGCMKRNRVDGLIYMSNPPRLEIVFQDGD